MTAVQGNTTFHQALFAFCTPFATHHSFLFFIRCCSIWILTRDYHWFTNTGRS